MDFSDFFKTEYLAQLYDRRLSKSKAKGIDKINSISFSNKLDSEIELIVRKVNSNNYSFSPFLENLIIKGRDKYPRIISIPTLRDRIVLLTIKEIIHQKCSESVQRKLPNSYIREIKMDIETSNNRKHYIKLDIKNFYDNIDRNILIDNLTSRGLEEPILDLIKMAISTPTIPSNIKKSDYDNFIISKGVPQGLSISNLLAQLYLEDFDKKISEQVDFYSRYVDDIIILNNGSFTNLKYSRIKNILLDLNLELNEEKTEKNRISKGFNFLSYRISDKRISIAEKNVDLFIRRVAGKFTWFKNGIKDKSRRPIWLQDDSRFKEVFIEELNETITGIISSSRNFGWIFYFSEITDESLLFKIDKIISGFFIKLKPFDYKAPNTLKRLSRTHKVIKYGGNKNYICNYDNYDTVRRKRDYLIFRGKIDPEGVYTDERIDLLFSRFRKRQIEKIERDIGYGYI